MAATTRVTLTIELIFGPKATFNFHVPADVVSPTDPIITGLITVLEAITRGKVLHIVISLSKGTTNDFVAAVAYKSGDKALMRFTDENGVSHAYKVPGLLASIIEDDKEGIDSEDTDVQAYTLAVTTNAKTAAGDMVAFFISGHRSENRNLIKAGRI